MADRFLDTNILVYAFSGDPRSLIAQNLMSVPFAISAQVLNEFANVARKKLGMTWTEVEMAVDDIRIMAETVIPLDEDITVSAIQLARRYGFSFYDASIIAAAISGGCTHCMTEDMQDGLRIDDRLTIRNPFADA